jgi:hypothetical protein
LAAEVVGSEAVVLSAGAAVGVGVPYLIASAALRSAACCSALVGSCGVASGVSSRAHVVLAV